MFYFIRVKYPNTTLIWSDMLPRTSWRYSLSARSGNKTRKRNQRRARSLFQNEGGVVIHHPALEQFRGYLARDGVHLTEEGMEVLLADFEEELTKLICSW